MRTIIATLCVGAAVLGASLVVKADIARPKPSAQTPTKSVPSSLEIVPDAKATEAKLQIRQSDMNELRAAIEGTWSSHSFAANITRSGPRTIIAGLLLFLSVSFGGVWLARASRSTSGIKRAHKVVAIAMIAIATIGAAAIITRGNAGPPPAYRWRNLPTNLSEGKSTVGPLVIEVIPDEAGAPIGMKLIIPLKKQNGRGEDE